MKVHEKYKNFNRSVHICVPVDLWDLQLQPSSYSHGEQVHDATLNKSRANLTRTRAARPPSGRPAWYPLLYDAATFQRDNVTTCNFLEQESRRPATGAGRPACARPPGPTWQHHEAPFRRVMEVCNPALFPAEISIFHQFCLLILKFGNKTTKMSYMIHATFNGHGFYALCKYKCLVTTIILGSCSCLSC